MTKSYSADQFRYLIHDNPREPMMEVHAYHPETGRAVGRLAVRARGFAERGQKHGPPVDDPQIRGAYVHPDVQRMGVGTELYDIAAHHLGKSIMHDTSVTREAQAWAGKVGGALHPDMTTGMSYDKDDLRRSFDKHYTDTYEQNLTTPSALGHPFERPKARQLAFKFDFGGAPEASAPPEQPSQLREPVRNPARMVRFPGWNRVGLR